MANFKEHTNSKYMDNLKYSILLYKKDKDSLEELLFDRFSCSGYRWNYFGNKLHDAIFNFENYTRLRFYKNNELFHNTNDYPVGYEVPCIIWNEQANEFINLIYKS